MKNLFTLLLILFSIKVFSQTHKAIHSLKIQLNNDNILVIPPKGKFLTEEEYSKLRKNDTIR